MSERCRPWGPLRGRSVGVKERHILSMIHLGEDSEPAVSLSRPGHRHSQDRGLEPGSWGEPRREQLLTWKKRFLGQVSGRAKVVGGALPRKPDDPVTSNPGPCLQLPVFVLRPGIRMFSFSSVLSLCGGSVRMCTFSTVGRVSVVVIRELGGQHPRFWCLHLQVN